MGKVKTHIKKRKSEIKQWKQNFEGLTEDEKGEELKRLNSEISWRAQDIAAKEAEVAALYVERTSAEGVIESLKVKELVAKKGYLKKDLTEDPRFKALVQERDKMKQKLANNGKGSSKK